MHIGRLTDMDSLAQVTCLEAEIWGTSDPTPGALLSVFAQHGGLVLGAFDGEALIGTSLGFPARDGQGQFYLHSHLLGVLPPYRGRRLGAQLKWAQWQFAQEQGFPYIGWTYDPLMATNAWFNIGVLGARVTDVLANVYGVLSDALNGLMPTHRFFVQWNPSWPPTPMPPRLRRLPIPEGVSYRRQHHPEAAREEADQFLARALALVTLGLSVVGVERHEQQVTYLWGPKEGDEHQD